MLRASIASSETGSVFLQWVEYATLFVEALAVLLIVIGVWLRWRVTSLISVSGAERAISTISSRFAWRKH